MLSVARTHVRISLRVRGGCALDVYIQGTSTSHAQRYANVRSGHTCSAGDKVALKGLREPALYGFKFKSSFPLSSYFVSGSSLSARASEGFESLSMVRKTVQEKDTSSH